MFGGDDWKAFGISYQSLVPKKKECVNLLTSTCPSSSHVAYGAIRIEFTFMALGQACATAAVIAIDDKQKVQDIDYKKLQSRLRKDKQVMALWWGSLADYQLHSGWATCPAGHSNSRRSTISYLFYSQTIHNFNKPIILMIRYHHTQWLVAVYCPPWLFQHVTQERVQ